VDEVEKGDLLIVSLERMMHIVEYIVVGGWNKMLLGGIWAWPWAPSLQYPQPVAWKYKLGMATRGVALT
jgi:hypothetical protein